MTSWGGNRFYAQVKKVQEPVRYFQTTQGGICSNFNRLFLAYLSASRNASSLNVHDTPSCIGENYPLFQSILKENSTIKYLKEIPSNSTGLDDNAIFSGKDLVQSTKFQTLKRMARDLFFYNGDIQEKIMTRIRSAGLERTLFDVGVHIRSGDKITKGEMKKIPMQDYLAALTSFSKRMGKPNLNVFVMTDNLKLFEELKSISPSSWRYVTLQNPSAYTMNGHTQSQFLLLSEKDRLEYFYQFLTELHILQNTPNLVVTYSSNIGRFLYLTSRFTLSSDSIISLDIPEWSLVV